MPEIIYTNYEEDELHDVVVLENLVAAGKYRGIQDPSYRIRLQRRLYGISSVFKLHALFAKLNFVQKTIIVKCKIPKLTFKTPLKSHFFIKTGFFGMQNTPH